MKQNKLLAWCIFLFTLANFEVLQDGWLSSYSLQIVLVSLLSNTVTSYMILWSNITVHE